MRVWAATRDENKVLSETVQEFPSARAHTGEQWSAVIGELCHALDLARPLLLKKHEHELNSFRHTAFTPEDFMEPVSFKKLTIEIFPEKTKKENGN